ncbi:MAG: cryptochrome/photolyase family protein [Candidatus Babeliaceae bacterium]|nr:cryptochrome/photolyase family protein [Candidatus Babeliaceae bacterium]
MTKEVLILFPHQLFENHAALKKDRIISLLEDDYFFSKFSFHKKKLIFHRAGMKSYGEMLTKNGYQVVYFSHPTVRDEHLGLFAYIKTNSIHTCHYIDPTDKILEKELIMTAQRKNIKLVRHDSPMFLATSQEIESFLGDKSHYSMASFYIDQRKRYSILTQDNKPVGGRWSFDTENRKKFPTELYLPSLKEFVKNSHIVKAQIEIEKEFSKNPGSAENFIFPINHKDSKKWLADFLHHRLNNFGDFQDAISKKVSFGYHSLLSPLLNAGLLTPEYVIKTTLEHAEKYQIPLNSLEGFIRQIIGWREFMRGVYQIKSEFIQEQNFFNHTQKLPPSFWSASTGIEPLDDAINHTLENSYAHHIERLMILGNFMLLTEIEPHKAYKWFMEMFIDAYDWVMIPNVYSMSQYADNGLITTKPYISGSNYILKMSDYKKGPWCSVWDGLYWRFIFKNINTISKNPRLRVMKSYLTRMDDKVLKAHIKNAENFLNDFY